jgi:Fur family ferric uptake transcriptional regulator
MNAKDSYEIFLSEYKKNIKKLGFNTTYHRDLVLKALFYSSSYINAKEIKEKIKDECRVDIRLSLVLKILLFLEKINVVGIITIPKQKDKKYRLLHHAGDGCFICKRCGRVEEFHNKNFALLLQEIAKKHDFKIDTKRTVIFFK